MAQTTGLARTSARCILKIHKMKSYQTKTVHYVFAADLERRMYTVNGFGKM